MCSGKTQNFELLMQKMALLMIKDRVDVETKFLHSLPFADVAMLETA
jgi:hypothetical protein